MLYWDPSPAVFSFPLPLLGRPLLWYGLLFACGFFCGYLILKRSLRNKEITDSLLTYLLIGMLVGARLFDLLFYQNHQTLAHDPLSALRFWEGGLASHGGAIGVVVAALLFARKPKNNLPFRQLLDHLVVPACCLAVWIRIGNFMNQEVLGTPSQLPWAVLFAHPADGSPAVPRHPVQLYETLFYLIMMLLFWRKPQKNGTLAGIALVSLFSFRFGIEFLKEEQSALMGTDSLFTMGQLLSIILIAWGIYLFRTAKKGSDSTA